jgi:hypothetical protein
MDVRCEVVSARWSFGMLLAFAAAAAGAQPTPSTAWSPVVQPIPAPAASASGQPQLTVSSRGVLLSWIEPSGTRATLKLSEWADNRWSDPRVLSSGDDWFVNWADVPSVLRLDDGTLVGHWLQKSGRDTYAYDVRLSYSKDDGRTWSPSFTPHHDGTRTEHGFASLFQMPGQGLGLVWLDGRAMAKDSAHGAQADGGSGAMSVRFASFDRQWQQTAETAVDLRVCECCPTAAAVTSEGPIAAFRNRTDDEVRDIHISRFANGKWSDPAAVFDDGWRIAACPVNGPMLSARGRDVAIAWFTARGDEGRTFVAFSNDAGRSFGPPIRVDDSSSLGRVDVELMADGPALVSWIEFADQRAEFRMRKVDRSGARSTPVTISGIAGSRASGYPRMAATRHEVVFAWTQSVDGALRVQTAAMRLSPGAAR